MTRILTLLAAFAMWIAAFAEKPAATVTSPNGWLVVNVLENGGQPVYNVTYTGIPILENSPLGLVADFTDFSKGMKLTGIHTDSIKTSYDVPFAKTRHNNYHANTMICDFENADGEKMSVEFRVSHCNIAFRYNLPVAKGARGAVRVMEEKTGYRLPDNSTAFMTHQSDPMVGWKRTKPSYEEDYIIDAPIDTPSAFGHGFTFPAVFHIGDKAWAMLTETGVDSRYCASRLSDRENGVFSIKFPMPEENNGNGTSEPAFALPGSTPWRTITVGHSPRPLATTTVMWDVVEPRFEAKADYKPGKSTWSWILWQDPSINKEDITKFIDLSAEMGYPYTLVDAGWDKNIGREEMAKLAKYAQSKGVDLLLWYSSSGYWNDIMQTPIDIMDNSIARKKEMEWMKSIGVKGIKVDFFGGDKQETMRLYEDILSDANDNGLMVIFHGCTLPRGWERMYPNYIGSEAVLASENMIFSQGYADKEPVYATLHPMIRNAAGAMEYGGTFLNRRMNRGDDGGSTRRSSDAFQLALAVIYQNPMQNFALAPNNLTEENKVALDFLREVPTLWDEMVLVDGFPGKYAVVARRNGADWYVGGINAQPEAAKMNLDLTFLGNGEAQLITLGKNGRAQSKTVKLNPDKKGKISLPVTLPTNDGFVLVKK